MDPDALALLRSYFGALTTTPARFDALPNPRNRFVLTTEDQGAEMHCQRGNSSPLHQIAFDWLDEILAT